MPEHVSKRWLDRNGTGAVISIIYISNAAKPLRAAELDDILATSRRNNARVGVTGMLVYMDGSFIQALEGDAEAVDSLISRIADDPRHRDFVVIARYPVAERQFPDWSMGYRRCDGAPPAELAEHFVNLGRPVFVEGSERAGSVAHKLIEGFRRRSRG